MLCFSNPLGALRCTASQQAKTGLPPQHAKTARAGDPGLLGAAAREPAAQGEFFFVAFYGTTEVVP